MGIFSVHWKRLFLGFVFCIFFEYFCIFIIIILLLSGTYLSLVVRYQLCFVWFRWTDVHQDQKKRGEILEEKEIETHDWANRKRERERRGEEVEKYRWTERRIFVSKKWDEQVKKIERKHMKEIKRWYRSLKRFRTTRERVIEWENQEEVEKREKRRQRVSI